jgi:gluconate 2-dehydrogenase gamma chain
MDASQLTRRSFLADASRGVIASWVALNLPLVGSLAGCARDDARNGSEFTTLSAAEARAMRALAAQIIPSDADGAGAEEAGAVYFIDRALAQPYFAESLPLIRAGLADLDERARAINGKWEFGSLPSSQQMTIIREIEQKPFFAAARTLVVIGTFADPSHGGNRDHTGWKLVKMEHQPTYTTPFGWYDAQATIEAPKRVA